MSRSTFVDLVEWYVDAGVDLALEELPRDHFTEAQRAAAERSTREPVKPPVASHAAAPSRALTPIAASLSAEEAVYAARQHAAAARTIGELRAALEAFEGCSLKVTATRLVFADGAESADVMLVGGVPDEEDDRGGRPFAGRAGVLLDGMLAAIGLDRSKVRIANVVPWRPPGNRAPSPTETAICLPFIERHIALVGPEILVCLGDVPSTSLMGLRGGVGRTRGQWSEYAINGGRLGRLNAKAIATFHPGYLLRAPTQKRAVWRDLQAIARARAQSDKAAG